METDEAVKDWSEADKKWLEEKVPENLRTIAVRHGRKLFSMTMQAGASNHCFEILFQNIQAVEGKNMLAVLSRTMDDWFTVALKHFGYTPDQFKECKADVERLVMLADAAKQSGDRVSKGGIILDS